MHLEFEHFSFVPLFFFLSFRLLHTFSGEQEEKKQNCNHSHTLKWMMSVYFLKNHFLKCKQRKKNQIQYNLLQLFHFFLYFFFFLFYLLESFDVQKYIAGLNFENRNYICDLKLLYTISVELRIYRL